MGAVNGKIRSNASLNSIFFLIWGVIGHPGEGSGFKIWDKAESGDWRVHKLSILVR